MSSTQLECFQATMAHEKHTGVLFYARFTPDLDRRVRADLGIDEQADIAEHLGMFGPVPVAMRAPDDLEEPDYRQYYEDAELPEGSFIDEIGTLHVPGSSYHFTHWVSPLRKAQSFDEIESYPYLNVRGYSEDHMAEEVRRIHDRGGVAFCWVGHMYESSWQIRGYEEFLMDMACRPEWCEYILDKITEHNLAVATAAARAGVDYITTGDDVANQNTLMFAPEQWRKFMKPRWAKVYAAARAIKPDLQIWYHSDGNIAEIIGELADIGVTILNPVQPECVDPVAVKREHGQRIVLDGTIGTQTTMPFGTAEDVCQTVRRRVEEIGYDGALMLSPTHVLEPEVPLANIYSFVEAVREFGALPALRT